MGDVIGVLALLASLLGVIGALRRQLLNPCLLFSRGCVLEATKATGWEKPTTPPHHKCGVVRKFRRNFMSVACLFFVVLVSDGDGADSDDLSKGYDYLLGMKLWSLTLERVRLLENDLQQKTEEMAKLKVTLTLLSCSSSKQTW